MLDPPRWPSPVGSSPHRAGNVMYIMTPSNGNVTGEFLSQRPVARSFDVFFDLHMNKRLNKQSRRRWFETPSRSLWRHSGEKGMRLRRWPCRLFHGRFGGSTSWQDSWTAGWWDTGPDRQRSDPRRGAADGWSLKSVLKNKIHYWFDAMRT